MELLRKALPSNIQISYGIILWGTESGILDQHFLFAPKVSLSKYQFFLLLEFDPNNWGLNWTIYKISI